MRKYCDECEKEVETKIVSKIEEYDIRGETIAVEAQVLVCTECGEELFSKELDNATLVSVYNEYRRRHKLFFPEEIKEIREQYGLSQKNFSKLLNWEDRIINRYEKGALQDEEHNKLLVFLKKPENMRVYLTQSRTSLDPARVDKLLRLIDEFEKRDL